MYSRFRLFAVLACLAGVTRAGAEEAGVLVNAPNMKVLHCDLPGTGDRFVGSSAPGQLFFPGESVDVKLVLTPGPAEAAIDLQEITTRQPGRVIETGEGFTDTGGKAPLIAAEGHAIRHPLQVRIDGQGETPVEVKNLPVPAKFGTYAMILDRGSKRTFLGTVCRLPRPREYGTVENTPVFGDSSFFDRPENYELRAQEYARMGVRGFRAEIGWSENKDGKTDWTRHDKLFDALSHNGLRIMVTLGGHPEWTRPFGEPTPAIGWSPKTGGYSGTGDWCAEPKYYDRLGQWITTFCQRYWKDGHGGLWGLEHYNEPWEGGGISGWARDCLEYRKLMKVIATSAWRVDRRIKAAAASSIMNTEDKFYSAGEKEFDQYVDIFTDHYVPPNNCYGPMVAAAHGKISQETETWFVNSEFLLPQAMCQFMACGQQRLSPWHPRVLFDKLPGKEWKDNEYSTPTPLVAATAAFNYFTAGKPFKRLAFKDHLPWVFQFGEDDDKEALLVVFRELFTVGDTDKRNNLWSQLNYSDGVFVNNKDGLLNAYDMAGNLAPSDRKEIRGVGVQPIYVTCPKQGALAAIDRVRTAQMPCTGWIEFLPRDFTTPVTAPGAKVVVGFHNGATTDCHGKVRVTPPPGWEMAEPIVAIELKPGETKTLEFPVKKAVASPSNAYAFEFAYLNPGIERTQGDGPNSWREKYAETLNCVCIPKKTITVDGNLDDWKDIPGITLIAKKQKVDATENARRPWTELADKNADGTFAEVKLAYDEQFLYVSARVNDPTPQTDHGRLEGRDESHYFHSAASDSRSPYKEFLTKHPGHSFAEVPYVYCNPPEADSEFRGDRLQIGFDVDPADKPGWHDFAPDTDRVPYGFHAVPDTDYEYSLYLCSDGKSECWRLLAPGMPRMHDWPHQPRGPKTTGPLSGGKHVVRQEGNVRIYELAIPRTEMPELALKPGQDFGFTFRIGNDKGPQIDYGTDKAVTKVNGLTLHPYWERKPSCGVRWVLGE